MFPTSCESPGFSKRGFGIYSASQSSLRQMEREKAMDGLSDTDYRVSQRWVGTVALWLRLAFGFFGFLGTTGERQSARPVGWGLPLYGSAYASLPFRVAVSSRDDCPFSQLLLTRNPSLAYL
jgi:hypothetical protein